MTRFLSSSRYKNTYYDVDGVSIPSSKRQSLIGVSYIRHTAREGDSFDLLAIDILKDPQRYWEIADLNPHIPFPDEIEAGTVVRLPRS